MTEIFHISHINNFDGILDKNAILSKNRISSESINYQNIAYDEIQNRRQTFRIPFNDAGTLHDYVPFYFNSRSPMLYAIKNDKIPEIQMEDLVIFSTYCEHISENDKNFIFTDGHATMDLTEYFQDIDDLKELNWKVINSHYWIDFKEGKRYRQAEFLVKDSLELDLISKIGVYNSNILKKIQNKCTGKTFNFDIEVKRNWYF